MPDSESQQEESRQRMRTAWSERESWRFLRRLLGLVAVAVVVTGLLLALSWVLMGSREKALRCSCLNNVKNIGVSMFQYASDFDDHCPWRKGGAEPRTAWCDLGLLFPKYESSCFGFVCPASQDKHVDLVSPDESGGYPEFAEFAADDPTAVISYGYCFDGAGGRPWSLGSGNKAVRCLVADKKAGITATGPDLENAAHHAKGRNVLYSDGYVRWVEGVEALDPDEKDDDVGKPGATDYADWWSDPPWYGEGGE